MKNRIPTLEMRDDVDDIRERGYVWYCEDGEWESRGYMTSDIHARKVEEMGGEVKILMWNPEDTVRKTWTPP